MIYLFKKFSRYFLIIKAKFINNDIPIKKIHKTKKLVYLLETLIVGTLGGAIFFYINTPLPWMLGALTSVLLWNVVVKRSIYWSSKCCYAGMLLVGYNIGRTFTRETGQQILIQLPIMLLITILTVLFSLLQGYFIYKKTGITLHSALIGSAPGGLSQMVLLCDEILGADVTVVTFMQTARQLGVVFLIPFMVIHGLAGKNTISSTSTIVSNISTQQYLSLTHLLLIAIVVIASGFVASFMKMPTPFLMGPVFGIAFFVLCGFTAPPPSKGWINLAQVFIGIYTGARIDLSKLGNWKKLLPHTIFNVIGLLVFSLVLAYVLMYFHNVTVTTAFLSTAPGGIAEMALTAMTVHADISTVIAFQLFRVLFVLLIVPSLIKRVLHIFLNTQGHHKL